MKVIFTSSVKDVAYKGDIKNVTEGYFRNFLMPRNLAVFATDASLKAWDSKRKQIMLERENLAGQFEEMKRRLGDKKLTIEKKVTAKGTLYGGIKASDVVKALKDNLNTDVAVESVIVPDHIKTVGTHTVRIKLGEGVEATVDIEVVKKA